MTLPIVQFEKLPDATKLDILRKIFQACEYDPEDLPGHDPEAGDLAQTVFEAFTDAGIEFTHPDRRPHGYRVNQHNQFNGTGCRWSNVSIVEPMSRTHLMRGNIHCPAECTDSVIEADPDATEDQSYTLSIDAVLAHLAEAGIPVHAVDTSGGSWTVYLGEGGWDEATERYTQPMSIGPCVMVNGRLRSETFETSYGVRGDDEESFPLEGYDDPQDVADHIIHLYREWKSA